MLTTLISNAQEKRYEFKSIRVEYKSETKNMLYTTSGTKLVVIDNYGQLEWDEVNETEYNARTKAVNQTTHVVRLVKGDKYYDINMVEKTGTGITVNTSNLAQLGIGISYNPSIQKYAGKEGLKLFVNENGGTWHGEEIVAGKNCQVFTLMEVKMWMYKGLVLRTESNLLGTTHTEIATKVEEGNVIAENFFEVPSDVELTQIGIETLMGYDEEINEPIPMQVTNSEIKGISLQQFIDKVKIVNPGGYEINETQSMEDEGVYMVMFNKGTEPGKNIIYVLSPMTNINELKNSEDGPSILETYKIEGRETMFFRSDEQENQAIFGIIMMYPEYNAFLMIMSEHITTKQELEALVTKLKL